MECKVLFSISYNDERNINHSHGKVTISNSDQMFNWHRLALLHVLCAVVATFPKPRFCPCRQQFEIFFSLQMIFLYVQLLSAQLTTVSEYQARGQNPFCFGHAAEKDYRKRSYSINNYYTKQRITLISIAPYRS